MKDLRIQNLWRQRSREFAEFRKIFWSEVKLHLGFIFIGVMISAQLAVVYFRVPEVHWLLWPSVAVMSVLWPIMVCVSSFDLRTYWRYRRLRQIELRILEEFIKTDSVLREEAEADQYEAFNQSFEEFFAWKEKHPINRLRKWRKQHRWAWWRNW